MGRNSVKDVRFTVRMSKSDKEKLRRLADKKYRTESDLVRALIKQAYAVEFAKGA